VKTLKKYFAIVFCLFALSTLSSCTRLSNKEIQKHWWKAGGGYHIGDVLRFNENNIKGDTIFKNNNAVALITNCKKPWYKRDYVLTIRSLTKPYEYGIYHEKGAK
jgi:hypothetical protein